VNPTSVGCKIGAEVRVGFEAEPPGRGEGGLGSANAPRKLDGRSEWRVLGGKVAGEGRGKGRERVGRRRTGGTIEIKVTTVLT